MTSNPYILLCITMRGTGYNTGVEPLSRREGTSLGLGRIVTLHVLPLIHFMQDLLTYSVHMFL